jgi:putative sporulation protein YyaC
MTKFFVDSSNFDETFKLAAIPVLKYKPVIFCIGTDKATGDCFAPLIGTFLTKRHNINAFVYGTLASPITAKNISSWYEIVKSRHPYSPILCIDSCLGKSEDIGKIAIDFEPVLAGSASGKNLGAYGDASILGFVDRLTDNKYEIFKTPLGTVFNMADKVAENIAKIFEINKTINNENGENVRYQFNM